MAAFLEPIFLNEKMVLNCAAYLWKGVSTESETTDETGGTVEGKVSAGIPLLAKLLSPLQGEASASGKRSKTTKSARRYTMGGLHMAVLDELRHRKMLNSLTKEQIVGLDLEESCYVDVIAVLRPIEFYKLLETVRTAAPLALQLWRDFGAKLLKPQGAKGHEALKEFQKHAEKYQQSITTVIEKLEADYLVSKQLEMVLWTPGDIPQPIGIVDLDMADSSPAEIRAKLTGVRAHVIGKVSSKAGPSGQLNLLQRTVLSSVFEAIERLAGVPTDRTSLATYHSGMANARVVAEKLFSFSIPGPAIRVAAMSVCI